ncbi:MAG: hypothetical protein NVS9B4_25320 [Candidatus Acidiferrum sp.]
MWKKEDQKPQAEPVVSPSTQPAGNISANNPAAASRPPSSGVPSSSPSVAQVNRVPASISQGIKIKGEVTGSEDLFVDGVVEGKLNLANGSLTIGPNGVVTADVTAREVIVRGRVDGKVTGRDKVQVSSTGQITGEVQTQRLGIEEGALLRGKVEAGKPATKTTDTQTTAAVAGKSGDAAAFRSGTAAD